MAFMALRPEFSEQRDQGPSTPAVLPGGVACQGLGAIPVHDSCCPWREGIPTGLTDRCLPRELDAEKLVIPQA